MPKDYDIEDAFRKIENELINSMMRNLSQNRRNEGRMKLDFMAGRTT